MENTKNIKQIIALLLVIAVFVVAGCLGLKNQNGPASVLVSIEPIKIGFVGPLTGDVAVWGQSGLAGAELATKEVNDMGGINGRKIELIIEDDNTSEGGSVNAVNKLINIDKVTALLLGGGSGATASVVPIAQSNKIPSMVTIASMPSITSVGDYIFRSTQSDSSQGKFAADFVFDTLDKKNISIIYVTNAWGAGVEGVFKKEYLAKGGKIIYENGVLETDIDLKGELFKVKNNGSDALYFPVYPANALAGFKQIKELGITIPVVSGDTIDGNDILKNPVAEGIIYTAPKIYSPEEFLRKINSLKGFETLQPNTAAPTSYDGAKILFSAIERAGTNDSSKIKEELMKTSYVGVSNPVMEFDKNREVRTPVFEAKIVKNGVVESYTE